MSQQQPLVDKCRTFVGRVRSLARRVHSSLITQGSGECGHSEGAANAATSSHHVPSSGGGGPRGDEWMEWQPSPHDKHLLRSTWSDDFETLYQLGSDIYTGAEQEERYGTLTHPGEGNRCSFIFEHNPACKDLFPWMRLYEGEKWKDSTQFRQQALRFVQTIAQVVKNVYHMERLQPLLYDIGQRHVQYAVRGFQPHYWDAFQDAMEHALTQRMHSLEGVSEEDRKRAITVWRDIALYIIQHMKNGYDDGLKGINRFPPLTSWA